MGTYVVSSGGKEYSVQLRDDGTVLLDGAEIPLDVTSVGDHTFSLLMNGKSYTIAMAGENGSYDALIGGVPVKLDVQSERDRLLKRYAATSIGGKHRLEVHAPMPAMVSTIEVGVGDEVIEGQGLIILEAMKMENELRAHQSGKVKEIFVAEGKAVEKGELLMLLE